MTNDETFTVNCHVFALTPDTRAWVSRDSATGDVSLCYSLPSRRAAFTAEEWASFIKKGATLCGDQSGVMTSKSPPIINDKTRGQVAGFLRTTMWHIHDELDSASFQIPTDSWTSLQRDSLAGSLETLAMLLWHLPLPDVEAVGRPAADAAERDNSGGPDQVGSHIRYAGLNENAIENNPPKE